jgi:hypothetical protein
MNNNGLNNRNCLLIQPPSIRLKVEVDGIRLVGLIIAKTSIFLFDASLQSSPRGQVFLRGSPAGVLPPRTAIVSMDRRVVRIKTCRRLSSSHQEPTGHAPATKTPLKNSSPSNYASVFNPHFCFLDMHRGVRGDHNTLLQPLPRQLIHIRTLAPLDSIYLFVSKIY